MSEVAVSIPRRDPLEMKVLHAELTKAGQWILVVRITGEVQLEEGRSLLVAREVRLRATCRECYKPKEVLGG